MLYGKQINESTLLFLSFTTIVDICVHCYNTLVETIEIREIWNIKRKKWQRTFSSC